MSTDQTSSPSRSRLWLGFAGIYIIWGSTYLGIRIAVDTMPPFLMASLRFLIAGPLLLAAVKAQGMAWPSKGQIRDNVIVGTLLLLGGNGLVAWSEQYIPSGITALIIGIGPLFIVLTEWAWPGGSRPTVATFLGLALGFAGVAWLAAPWEEQHDSHLPLLPVVVILLACVSWALGSIYGRHIKQPAPPLMASSLQMIGGAIALGLVSLFHGEWAHFRIGQVSANSWWAFAYLVVVGSLVGFTTFVWLMKHSTPARVSTYAYVNPVVAVILGWLIADEDVSSRTAIAAAIIIAAVVIITTQKSRAKPAPASDVSPLPMGAKR